MALHDRLGDVDQLAAVVFEWSRIMSNALSALIAWRASRIPLACSIAPGVRTLPGGCGTRQNAAA